MVAKPKEILYDPGDVQVSRDRSGYCMAFATGIQSSQQEASLSANNLWGEGISFS